MDILNPDLLWIGKRCYRVNPVANEEQDSSQEQSTTKEYIEDELYGIEQEIDIDNSYDVIELGPNRYTTSSHVPPAFFGMIIGARGATKKRIESETRTQINVPKPRSTGDIEITGVSRDSVCSARRRIELIALGCRLKHQPTHFTCVQITDSTIKENFVKFKDTIINGPPTFGLQESMFTKPNKLHITFGVMCLMDDVDRSLATQLLYDCLENIVKPFKNEHGKIEIKLQGIEIMNDDPSSTRILYGKVESDALQQIANQITKFFIGKGLAKREFGRDTVKMHMTLINAKSATGAEDDGDTADHSKKRRHTKVKFDARNIMENYGDYHFGAQEVNEISLACMHTEGCDGFYEKTTKIEF